MPLNRMGSTDSNIPVSLGIPSITIGAFSGEGVHTREEFIEIESLKTGLIIALEFITRLTIE